MDAERQVCTFQVGGKWFGVDVLQVQEVVPSRPLTPVPLASPVIAGLLNLRGQIVTAIDLRRRMGMVDRTDGQGSLNVVLQADDGAVSLIVDEIGDVIQLTSDQLELPPEGLGTEDRDLVQFVCKQPERLIVILSPERVLRIADNNH